MKRLTRRMTLLFACLLSFALLGNVFSATRYVNGQDGNDTWDGSARVHVPSTTIGPKETINGAIEIASASGDIIEVHYADGFIYNEANPGNPAILNPAIQKTKQITFTSYGGVVTVQNWSIWANTAFTGPFVVANQLTLAGGNVTGGNQLTMANGTMVWRTLGAITSGQLNFAGIANFTYDAGTDVTTGLEMPPAASVNVINNVTTQQNPTTLVSTNLHLNENKTMNGILDLVDSGAVFDLETFTLTLVGPSPAVPSVIHQNRSDIIDGYLVFQLNGNNVVLNHNQRDLPNITVNTSGLLQIDTNGKIGVVTANGTTNVTLVAAGTSGNPIGGLVNNSTGTIELQKNGNINFEFIDPTDFAVPAVSQHWVKANSGRIYFSHASTGTAGTVNFGHVSLNGGQVQFIQSANNVVIKGAAEFIRGTWTMPGNPTTDPAARALQLAGQTHRFGENGQNADFSSTAAAPGIFAVDLLVKPIGSVTLQTINGNKPGSIWRGTMTVDNNTGLLPVVKFVDGHLRVLDNVQFLTGLVGVDNCILSIGNELAPFGFGAFANTSGFTGLNGGYIAMNGNALQSVSGVGDFGSFAANNAAGCLILGAVNSKEYFYLTKGVVDNTSSGVLNFDNSVNPPKIVKLNGAFNGTPTFVSMVDVEYQGNEKDYGPLATDPIYELPSVTNGDPAGNKLRNLLIKTQNNTVCANGYGWVRINDDVTVNGTLVIDTNQSLVVNDSRTLTLATGGTFNIQGHLFTMNDATLALGAPGGFNITTASYLPNIRIKPGSQNNMIRAKGLRVQSMSSPVSAFFCPDFNASLAALASGIPGDITFDANALAQFSSLSVNFTDPNFDHIADLNTNSGATLTLLNNLLQQNNLVHRSGAHILIGNFTYYLSGSTIDLWGSSETTSSTTGKLVFDGAASPIAVNLYQGSDPIINANVEVNLAAAGSILALQQAVVTPSDTLAINKTFTLRQGSVALGGPGFPVSLALLGQYFYLYGNGSFSVASPGTLFLKSTSAAMDWHIYNGPTAPTLNNLTVQNSVNLREDNNQVVIQGNYLHQLGTVALGTNDLVIAPLASFRHISGNYTADTGWLWQQSTNFNVGSQAFNIPNFRINAMANVTIGGAAIFTVQKRLDMYNGDYLTANNFAFDHKGFLQVADGVTVRYHSGTFLANGLPAAPAYTGFIHLITTNNLDRDLPTSVWPNTNPSLVQSLEVLTSTNDPDPVFPPSPLDVNALDPTIIRLLTNYQVNGSLLLRNGRLVIAANQVLTFGNGLDILRVDGAIVPETGASVSSNGTGYTMTYANNGNADIRFANAPYTNLAAPANPPSVANAPNHVPYMVSGPELPGTVETLTFTRNRDFVNKFTVLNKPVTVSGTSTLNIRNNLSVQQNATLTVLGDVYFENENDVFPSATDPVCEFWSPLVFAGPKTPQMVYVPKDGIDIRPPQNPAILPPPIGPARIMIAKDSPTTVVRVSGGNLRVDHISFRNGLLDTDENNHIEIPAPAPGLGQGFDRNGMVEGNVSHIIGRVMKRLSNAQFESWSSNERQEFPVGSMDQYRPMAFTFRNQVGQVTIPHNLELTAQHIDTPPRGSQGIPLADNCNVTTNTYSPFYWFVETNGTYTQEQFDLELTAAGLVRDENPADGIDGYSNVDDLRILRRHGDVSEINNTWVLQGNCADYDNAQYTSGPTVINENSKGGLRTEGAIFTIGLPYGELPVEKHFERELVWNGNPYNAMTFYITKAEYYGGRALQPGDEIGIYDGSNCVGFIKLNQPATKTAPAIVICSQDDNPSDAVVNGFRNGNSILYKIWDSKTGNLYRVDNMTYFKVNVDQPETGTIVFQGQSSTRVELNHAEQQVPGQDIYLTKGWNIFSLAVNPNPVLNMFDTVTPNQLGNGILNTIEPQLTKVVGTNDGTIEKLLFQWYNTIGDWDASEGYYINVKEDVLLHVPGAILDSPTSITLHEKWNIVSYPCFDSEQNALNVLQPLIDAGVLKKAMDQYGHALEYLAFVGWYNGIGNLRPGEGYYIYVTAPITFDITCPAQVAKTTAIAEAAQPQHFQRAEGNPYMPMNFYVNEMKINEQELAIGDEIAVFDGDKLVGAAVVQQTLSQDRPLALVASMDDGENTGFTQGNAISFKVWKAAENAELSIDTQDITYLDSERGISSGSASFEPRATATITINAKPTAEAIPQAFELKQNYPNPFNPTTTITFAIPNDAKVRVQIYDITGKLVTTLVDAHHAAGYYPVEWNGLDSNGTQVATGIYFYKMTAGSFVETRKMILAK